ncbi:unnamed protein product [Allacma fusca]|uniref:C2H2-type domain-containing protein n=1 Tax=Allacma fusca TaxID=39272 RepID=A0A8J2L722_9HEXA|nr:unnamed protein product [Allacma fusca]
MSVGSNQVTEEVSADSEIIHRLQVPQIVVWVATDPGAAYADPNGEYFLVNNIYGIGINKFDNRIRYKIHWLKYESNADTWEPIENLQEILVEVENVHLLTLNYCLEKSFSKDSNDSIKFWLNHLQQNNMNDNQLEDMDCMEINNDCKKQRNPPILPPTEGENIQPFVENNVHQNKAKQKTKSKLQTKKRPRKKTAPFCCQFCERCYTTEAILERHVKLKHSSRAGNSRQLLKSVESVSIANEPASCNACGKEFRNLLQLNLHLRNCNDFRRSIGNNSRDSHNNICKTGKGSKKPKSAPNSQLGSQSFTITAQDVEAGYNGKN